MLIFAEGASGNLLERTPAGPLTSNLEAEAMMMIILTRMKQKQKQNTHQRFFTVGGTREVGSKRGNAKTYGP